MDIILGIKLFFGISLAIISIKYFFKYIHFKKNGFKTKAKIVGRSKTVASEGYNHFFTIEYYFKEQLVNKKTGVIGPFLNPKMEEIKILIDKQDSSEIIVDEWFNNFVYYGFTIILLLNVTLELL